MATSSSGQKETPRDWKVLLMCTTIYFFQGGIQRTKTLLFVECINRYNLTREKATIPFTISYLIWFSVGPFTGYLANHFQLRNIITIGSALSAIGVFANFWAEDVIGLIIFWGILFGLGLGTTTGLLMEIINRHFDKHLSTAFGLYYVGASIGATIMPYIANILIAYYGLSGTFLILGGLALNTIPLSLSLPVYSEELIQPLSIDDNDQNRVPIEESECKPSLYVTPQSQIMDIEASDKTASHKTGDQTPKPPHKQTVFSVFLNPIFMVICIIQSSFSGVATTLNIILVDYCIEKGITLDQGVYVMMTIAVMDIVGRVGLGWITDYGYIGAVNFLSGDYVLMGLSCLLYIWSNGFVMCMVCSVVYGTLYGVAMAYSPKIIKDYIDPKDRTMAVASRNICFAPIAIAMPSILGYFKDTIKTYDGLMYALTAASILAAGLISFLPYLKKHQQMSLQPPQQSEERF